MTWNFLNERHNKTMTSENYKEQTKKWRIMRNAQIGLPIFVFAKKNEEKKLFDRKEKNPKRNWKKTSSQNIIW